MNDLKAIEEVLYPYIHSKRKRSPLLPKLKTMLTKAYPQVDGDKVLEIRVHESHLIRARQALGRLMDLSNDGE